MPIAPVTDVYACASGGRVSAGRFYRPAWRRSMVNRTWAQVPGNTLSSINPASNALVNPNHPSAAPWAAATGQAAIISAWGGACWDDTRCRFWLPLNGGHSDYYGNEPYVADLLQDSVTWEMLRDPSGSIAYPVANFNDGQEGTGLYSDERRRAIHGYNKHVYVPNVGPLVSVQGNTCPNPSGPNHTLLLDETTGEASYLATLSSPGSTTSGGASAYDPTRNRSYWIGSGDGNLSYFDHTTNTWTTLTGGSNNGLWADSQLVYVPTIDMLVHFATGATGGFQLWHPETGVKYTPGTTGTGAITPSGSCGAKWSSAVGAILCWNNSTDTEQITAMTPPESSPTTNAWTLGTLPVDPSNSVTPTAKSGNGTFGRFQVSERLGCALLLNATNQQIYAFALD